MANCTKCGIQKTIPGICITCTTKIARAVKYLDYKKRLDSLGYDLLTNSEEVTSNKVKVKLYRRICKHEMIAVLANVINQSSICVSCNGSKRAEYALKAYIEKFGRKYDLSLWEDYKSIVGQLSDANFKAHGSVINPAGHKRGRLDLNLDAWHLDHKIPIIECFKNGWDVHEAAAITNLQMLPARENLSKSKRLDEISKEILTGELLDMCWINNGKIVRFVRRESIESLAAQGWIEGKLPSQWGKHNVGSQWVTNGVQEQKLSKNKNIPIGWQKGRLENEDKKTRANEKRYITWKAKRAALENLQMLPARENMQKQRF